jgi:ribosome-binding protein aMBF1 (putative translation factor)
MKKTKMKKLESKGWKFGDAKDFLGLSDEEAKYIGLKLALSKSLRKQRQDKKLSQMQLAKILNSSQSRVAKMEAGDPTVSIDLLIRSLLALGVTTKKLAGVISTSKSCPAT